MILTTDLTLSQPGLIGELYVSKKATQIGYRCFFACTGLTNVVLPDTITTIAMQGFKDCTGLTNIDLGNNLINIFPQAFYGCSDLESVKIPATVTNIGNEAFKGCNGTLITFAGDELPETIGLNAFDGAIIADAISITLESAPTTIAYTVGDALDLTGVEVAALMKDGTTTLDVTNSVSFSPANGTILDTAGTVTVTGTYGSDKTVSFNVTVSASS